MPLKAVSEEESDTQAFSEDNAAWYIYGGYNVSYWTIIPSVFFEFSYNNEPYKIKQFGIKTNYSIFSFGLEYNNSNISFSNVFTINENDKENQSHLAEQLKIFNGLSFGKLSVYLSASYQKFNTTATSTQEKDINYYSKNDGLIIVKEHDTIEWFTRYSKYDLRFDYSTSDNGIFSLGIRYMNFEAPTEVDISKQNSTTSGGIILFTKNKIIDPYFGVTLKNRSSNSFYSLFSVSGSMLFTSYYPESQYFDIDYNNPLSFESFSITGVYTCSYAFHFTGEHYRIETGVKAEASMASLLYDSTLERDITARSQTGAPVTFNTGDAVELNFSRNEVFWGYYIKASSFF
ncbi:MAG: hypothetical protein CVV49_15815 [Spirochaetae bacterium HGW-Spirochaetae-5]|nr:MAG: hypothetical protein CVV49_15815 [Spirochaetae bacterium HGW-Spirochaetae-5]